jgi:hypothetical protein
MLNYLAQGPQQLLLYFLLSHNNYLKGMRGDERKREGKEKEERDKG